MKEGPIQFQPFNELGEVRIYKHGILPHWRQSGCTYFVTFRLAESLPGSVLRELEDNRHEWLRRHGIEPDLPDWKNQFAKLPGDQQREYEREVGTSMNEQLDRGFGSCELRRPELSLIAEEGLMHFHSDRVWTGDYVVMPNHVNALMTPIVPFELEDLLKSIKGFTAKEINRATGTSGTFWQRQSFDHIVRDSEQLRLFQNYIRDNPTKARLKEDSFRWVSAEYDCAKL
jgi:putative transposase